MAMKAVKTASSLPSKENKIITQGVDSIYSQNKESFEFLKPEQVSALLVSGFDTVEKLEEATIEDLVKVHSVGESTAKKIKSALAEKNED